MELLLDTSVLIDALRSRNARRELLVRLVNQGHHFSTTALNIAEVYAAVREEETALTASFIDSLECHDLTASSGRLAGMLKNGWARKGRTLSLTDTIIAAIAMENDCTLVTDNRKDFPMSELKLYPLQQKTRSLHQT
jgi:predicted nucleic acid-binding protein